MGIVETNIKDLYKMVPKKVLRDLGLHYIKIDACLSDCMLYSKEHANANECVVCGVSRWK